MDNSVLIFCYPNHIFSFVSSIKFQIIQILKAATVTMPIVISKQRCNQFRQLNMASNSANWTWQMKPLKKCYQKLLWC